MSARYPWAIASVLMFLPSSVGAAQSGADSAAAAATVQQFHEALAAADSGTALTLLAEDATILESGDLETRAEYRGHHLAGDITFARAVPTRHGSRTVTVEGDVAWVVSMASISGQYQDRKIDVQGAELVVLSRTPKGWRIRAIHWSSRPRPASK
jgi:ketosteroid isomerase-like protein